METPMASTPVMTKRVCPECEPEADFLKGMLEVSYCDTHAPARDGDMDKMADSDVMLSGSTEAGGLVNKVWCDLLHGRG